MILKHSYFKEASAVCLVAGDDRRRKASTSDCSCAVVSVAPVLVPAFGYAAEGSSYEGEKDECRLHG